MPGGPQPLTQNYRLELAHNIAQRVKRQYQHQLVAIGIYGSVARGTDKPYSDIEMCCVVHGLNIETNYEWSTGPWKAEVNVISEDVILKKAAEVDGDWPITHGSFTAVLVIYDPAGLFERIRQIVLAQPDELFRQVMAEVIVGELYERIGKIRNAQSTKNYSALPYFAVELAKFGACLIGLAHRHLYTSASSMFQESLALSNCPEGYAALCRLVITGRLADPAVIIEAANNFWAGVECWARAQDIAIETTLDNILP